MVCGNPGKFKQAFVTLNYLIRCIRLGTLKSNLVLNPVVVSVELFTPITKNNSLLSPIRLNFNEGPVLEVVLKMKDDIPKH